MKNLTLVFFAFLCACNATPEGNVNLISPTSTSNAIAEPTVAAETTAIVATENWWQPTPGSSWQVQFSGETIDTALDVDVYDLDLFDTPTDVVAELQARGIRVICYINAGAWEDWRPDIADFPAEVMGNDLEGWPGERWLDVGNIGALAPIMEARLDLCKEKGFDGVDPDNLDGYYQDTGFEITEEEQIAYLQWLAEAAHTRGLGIGLKNVPELAEQLEPVFDWALLESCFAQGWCADMELFIANGKPVFAIEYIEAGMTLGDFCPEAADLGFSAILKNRDLDAWVEDCEHDIAKVIESKKGNF